MQHERPDTLERRLYAPSTAGDNDMAPYRDRDAGALA